MTHTHTHTHTHTKLEITKREHAFKGFASPYNVEILNSFNPEPQL